MPIQVFESEERTPRTSKHNKPEGIPEGLGGVVGPNIPGSLGGPSGPTPFGANPIMMGGPPNDMSWMMGMPPGMNPAAAAAMMQMRMAAAAGGGGDTFRFGMFFSLFYLFFTHSG